MGHTVRRLSVVPPIFFIPRWRMAAPTEQTLHDAITDGLEEKRQRLKAIQLEAEEIRAFMETLKAQKKQLEQLATNAKKSQNARHKQNKRIYRRRANSKGKRSAQTADG
ncbi:predicted protein [Uncinocarpus reesii 1704]|uniref:Uncharacterized protein n=1 Tax=Uncinocarpus reesii (strain UAMH 1704) TaxID=336963 RepID=C4JKY6_UNCRE|nr:uncharacterized protein UREG_00186 [Uncinocarpus reesii 1704]EEP75340.1 predicted protein [Uncinocarpus reesii 1704]